jgi:protein required for attachment to host cells
VLTATVTTPAAAITATIAAAAVADSANKQHGNGSSSSDSSDSDNSSSSDEAVDNSSRNRALLQRKSLQDRLQRVGATPTNRDPPEIEVRTCDSC